MASQPPYNSRDVHAQRRASIPVFDSNTNLHSNYECSKGEYKLIIKEKHKDHAQSSEAITFELMDNLHTQLTRSQTWVFRWNDRPEGLGDVLPTRRRRPPAGYKKHRTTGEIYDIKREYMAYGLWYREEAKLVTDLGEYRPKPMNSTSF